VKTAVSQLLLTPLKLCLLKCYISPALVISISRFCPSTIDKSRNPLSITNSVAPEPRDSSRHSPMPATGPCPEKGNCTPHSPPAFLPKIRSNPNLPSTPVFQVVFFPLAFPPKPCTNFFPLPRVPHAPPISFSLI
jgi:hypothetical protein